MHVVVWLNFQVILLCFDVVRFFFFNDPATTEIYTLSLHDALPISHPGLAQHVAADEPIRVGLLRVLDADHASAVAREPVGEEWQDRRLLEREDCDALEDPRHRTVRRSTTRTALP